MAAMNVTENDFLPSQYSCFNASLNFFTVLNERRKRNKKEKQKENENERNVKLEYARLKTDERWNWT